MTRYVFPALAGAALIVGAAIIQGNYTERWKPREITEDLRYFAKQLNNVPAQFGDWDSQVLPDDERQLLAAEIVGSVSRAYFNRLDPSKAVQVFLVCGHGLPISGHTPDKCYRASGFVAREAEDRRQFVEYGNSQHAEFKTNSFHMPGDETRELRIFWSFCRGDGQWVAPISEKFSLGDSPALYKIYVISEVPMNSEAMNAGACEQFLQDFLPELNEALFTPKTEATQPSESSGAPAEGTDSPAPEPAQTEEKK